MLVFNESTPPLSLKVIQFLLDEKKKNLTEEGYARSTRLDKVRLRDDDEILSIGGNLVTFLSVTFKMVQENFIVIMFIYNC